MRHFCEFPATQLNIYNPHRNLFQNAILVKRYLYDIRLDRTLGNWDQFTLRLTWNTEHENKIYENDGVPAYEEYQFKNENETLQKGPVFRAVKAFWELNTLQE